MNFVIGLILLFLLLSAIKQFARMDTTAAARLVRHGGGVLGLIGAALLLLRGRVGFAAALAGMAASFAGWRAFGPAWTSFRTSGPGAGAGSGSGRVSTARSAMIEMRLDHDSGIISGKVLGGVRAGKALEALSRPELLNLREELLRDDPDGANLLEAYLDRRFAGWREAQQSEGETGRRSRSGGPMSRDEAYEILGLPKGAGREEIVAAHRER